MGFKTQQQSKSKGKLLTSCSSINTTLCSLRSCALSLDLPVLASSLGELTSERLNTAFQDCHRTVNRACRSSGTRCIRIDQGSISITLDASGVVLKDYGPRLWLKSHALQEMLAQQLLWMPSSTPPLLLTEQSSSAASIARSRTEVHGHT